MTSKTDQQRFDRLRRIGCICSRKLGLGWVAPEMHHIVGSSYRKHSGGNKATIPLSAWFHRGEPPNGMRPSEATKQFGPSLRLDKKAFIERFGTERELLAEVDDLLTEIEKRFT